jgi:hypothetical protein
MNLGEIILEIHNLKSQLEILDSDYLKKESEYILNADNICSHSIAEELGSQTLIMDEMKSKLETLEGVYNKTRHSEQCLSIQKQYLEYLLKYPNHCTACDGTGEIRWKENGAPYGAGYWPMDVSDICTCIDNNNCPRCGKLECISQSLDKHGNDSHSCEECGWKSGDDGGVILECYCGDEMSYKESLDTSLLYTPEEDDSERDIF